MCVSEVTLSHPFFRNSFSSRAAMMDLWPAAVWRRGHAGQVSELIATACCHGNQPMSDMWMMGVGGKGRCVWLQIIPQYL